MKRSMLSKPHLCYLTIYVGHRLGSVFMMMQHFHRDSTWNILLRSVFASGLIELLAEFLLLDLWCDWMLFLPGIALHVSLSNRSLQGP